MSCYSHLQFVKDCSKHGRNLVFLVRTYRYVSKTSNASHCIEIRIYGILELGPLLERLKRIVIGMVLSPTDELWHGFESWLTTMVIGKGGDLNIKMAKKFALLKKSDFRISKKINALLLLLYLNICKIPRNLTYLQIFDLRLQTFADIGKNQYFQYDKYANICSYLHLYVGCELLPGFAHAWTVLLCS